MRAHYSLLIITLFFAGLFLTDFVIKETMPPSVTSEAVDADVHLVNSKIYLDTESIESAKKKLKSAISSVKMLKNHYDDESIRHIDHGLNKLYEVDSLLDTEVIVLDKVINSYILMLNALTYAQIREAELFVENGDRKSAKTALKHALEHIRNAIKLTEGSKRQSEVVLYTEINEIIENEDLPTDEIITRLELMLDELENLEIELSYAEQTYSTSAS